MVPPLAEELGCFYTDTHWSSGEGFAGSPAGLHLLPAVQAAEWTLAGAEAPRHRDGDFGSWQAERAPEGCSPGSTGREPTASAAHGICLLALKL